MSLDLHRHPETDTLVEVLRAVPHGGTVSYADLTAAIGNDVTGPARPRLASARRIALRDYGAAFQVEYRTGLKRLMPDQAPDLGATARRRIKRVSNSARKAMTSMAEHSNGLSPEAARKMSAEMSAHGLIAQITSDKSVSAIHAKSERPEPPAKVAETFLAHLRSRA